MSEDAGTKAKRRQRARDSFPPPLNEIALRHVDSVQALSDSQRENLACALQKCGPGRLGEFLKVIKSSAEDLKDANALIALLERGGKGVLPAAATTGLSAGSSRDKEYLSKLLVRCFPDMPQSSADALAASEVMSAALKVIAATRYAVEDARSDFVITTLYSLFEDRLKAISALINENPAFIKAIQRSRPDWNTRK